MRPTADTVNNELIIEGLLSETETKIIDLNLALAYNRDIPVHVFTEKEKSIPDLARYTNQIIATDGLCIIETSMYAQKDIEGYLNIYGPHVILSFLFDKKPEYSQKLSISGMIEVYADRKSSHYQWLGERQSNYIISIILSRDYYLKISKEEEWVQNFPLYKMVYNQMPYHSVQHQFSINLPIRNLLTKILINPYTGQLKRQYIDTNIKSLLADLAEQEYHSNENAAPLHLDETTERLYQAKQILENNIQNPPTIKQLSRMVLLNEMKLKNGFKELFGVTIRNYVIKLRMETAHNMMTQENTLIFEVAMRLGYKDTSHFINAFKSHFGYTPKYFCTNIRQTLKTLLPLYIFLRHGMDILNSVMESFGQTVLG